MKRGDVFLGTTLESRYRLDVTVSEAPDFFVFQGHDLQSDAPVVIRMARALRGTSLQELSAALDAFAVEARQLEQLAKASSDVERLLAFGQIDHPDQECLAYCVFADIEGMPLSQARPPAPLSLAGAVAMLEPVAAALSTAHDLGSFHGDVRPDNIIVVDDAGRTTTKLARFTRATRLGSAPRAFSPAYGAPEHFKRSSGESGIGPATDTYGLALCVVELVTGTPPRTGTSPNELYKQAMDIARRPSLDGRADAVIARALAVDPKLRWPTTRELWSALVALSGATSPTHPISSATLPIPISSASILSAAPLPARPPPLPLPLPLPLPAPVAPPAPMSVARGHGRARLVVGVAIGLAILALGGLLTRSISNRTQVSSGHTDAATTVSDDSSMIAVPVTSTSAHAPVVARAPTPPSPDGMIRIPAGTFTMGKDTEGKGDRPAHRVVLTRAFYMDKTEVTIDAYLACVEQGSCTPRSTHLRTTPSGVWGCNLDKEHGAYPANCIDRKQAAAYCKFVKKRLPTEAEWEYAARGSDERDYPWGNTVPTTCAMAVLSGMTGACGDRHGTSPVGTAADGVSPFGALDMGGNVWEWVADDYAPYPSEEVTDPAVTITDSPDRRGILRGGSWDYGPQSAKTTYRLPFISEAAYPSIGVRCAQTE